jgi:hypothetical protein
MHGVFAVSSLLFLGSPAAAGGRVDFRTSILPVLTKAGCNGGACHGAATGQGGFKLSLLGYDPEEDHRRITRERRGRRIDLEAPEESLLLRKPLRLLPHRGGRRIQPGSAAEETLVRWLRAGAPYGPRDLRVARIEAAPAEAFLSAAGDEAEIRVAAVLSDGTREDVTSLALYASNDEGIAEVDAGGRVVARRPGVTSIMVRHGGEVQAVRVVFPFPEDPSAEAAFAAFTPRNFIDEIVLAELRRLRLPASPLSDDAEFLRRVHLDLAGRLPEPGEARAFLAEPPSAEKRKRLIDGLLRSDGFADLWTLRLSDLLLAGGKRSSAAAAAAEHAWLRDRIARGVPFDRLVQEIITAEGDARENGAAGFHLLASDPRDLAEHAAGMFLGIQLGCARCHAHPTDRWTRADHLAFAAYFAGVEREGDVVRWTGRRKLEEPGTGKPVAPRPLGAAAETEAAPEADGDPRPRLAAWLTSSKNPLFARAIANRVWKHLAGRGLVEPAGDLRPTNPPSSPALLDALAADFVAGGHDLRRLVRAIARSRTYQLTCRSTPANARDDRLFSRAFPRPLEAQVFLDAVSQAAGVPERFPGVPEGTRAVELGGAGTPSAALDVLGRCRRERDCEAAGRSSGGIAQALHLLNGPTIHDKLRGGVLARLEARGASDREAVTELYLRAFARFPEAGELAAWEPLLAAATDRREALEDLLWALLNSREFAFNH